ncbi:MAG: DUF2007 domain-containing protein [Planctomycetes bacterium]|nr:DUF2007 domain-containing protein [Planctomycetota bacterium]
MSEAMVPLYEAADLIEAHLLQARLEEAGIESFIENEATSAAFSGIQDELGASPTVLVPEESLAQAEEVLEAFLDEADADADAEDADWEDEESGGEEDEGGEDEGEEPPDDE